MTTPARPTLTRENLKPLTDAELDEYWQGFEALLTMGIDASADPDGLSVMRLVYEVKQLRADLAQVQAERDALKAEVARLEARLDDLDDQGPPAPPETQP